MDTGFKERLRWEKIAAQLYACKGRLEVVT
jgi:hypothetical protein